MNRETDIVLIGAGIMSSTVGVFLKELEPSFSVAMFETLEDCANCEMNYTPQRPNGSVDISRALQVYVEFGTELVGAADHSLVALLGASPGASTAAFIAISVLQKCFAGELTEQAWQPKLKQMIPSCGHSLIDDAELTRTIRRDTARVLGIEDVSPARTPMQAQP